MARYGSGKDRRPPTAVEPAVWWQAVVVVAIAVIATSWALHAHRQPMEAGELAVVVSKLASHAAEGRALLEQRRANALNRAFVVRHARQLQKKAQSLRETLHDEKSEPEIDGARRSAADAAATLAAVLGVLSDTQRETVNAGELERLVRQLDALERTLQPPGS